MALERGPRPTVVKVGGSLYDLPDLGPRLRHWLHSVNRPLLVPGGGAGAEVIRQLHATHRFGEDVADRLALQVLHVNAHVLAALLPDSDVVADTAACPAAWEQRRVPILDVQAFARMDDGRPGCLPHTWDVTSDSLAARVAAVAESGRLALLKSTALPPGISWEAAGRLGLVDPYFARVVAGLEVQWVNLRAWQP